MTLEMSPMARSLSSTTLEAMSSDRPSSSDDDTDSAALTVNDRNKKIEPKLHNRYIFLFFVIVKLGYWTKATKELTNSIYNIPQH